MKFAAATSNEHKLREFRQILQGHEILSAAEAGFCGEVDETGTTFEENALLKARAVYRATGICALADDSGLCVPALGGAPGIFSARYAGIYAPGEFSGSKDENNRKLLLRNLEGKSDRSAYFCCAAALVGEDFELVCVGKTYGTILFSERGEGGFGYDPLFWSDELLCSFAEASEAQKNRVSHRGKALLNLMSEFQRRKEWEGTKSNRK